MLLNLALPEIGFSVSHQKVELDVDFSKKRLSGRTEISVNPHGKDLKIVRLNCRQCVLKRIGVNGKDCTWKYRDPYQRVRIYDNATVHQHHQIQRLLEPVTKFPQDGELEVHIPKGVKIVESIGAQPTVITPSTKTEDLGARYNPITITIDFEVGSFRDGLHFVGCDEGDARYPHVYTRNTISPGSACCVFPCQDALTSRSTWEIAITCPRSVGDALRGGPPGNMETGITEDDDAQSQMSVVCSGDQISDVRYILVSYSSVLMANIRQDPHPTEPWKKTVSFIITNSVAARHIGIAVGAFEHVDLSAFRDEDEDEKLGQNAIKVDGYCLPGRSKEVENTCMPIAKAMDDFTLTYGSYPFSSYKLCFVDDAVSDTAETASLSICSNRLLFPADIIDPIDRVTRRLVYSLASQWAGVDIIAAQRTDLWVIVGIAYFITDMFMKKLCGNNEYRFWQKRMADKISELDIARPSIHAMGEMIDLDESELEFLSLKAPVVLFILDRRLVKAGGSSGLSRVVTRIFLNAKVGDLPNGTLTTAHFHRTCEKTGHTKLDSFFEQWVLGAGCPRFVVTQKYNRKKMVVEMRIQQTQHERSPGQDLDRDTFMRDVREREIEAAELRRVFTGPMTIRIHEADGTPLEHIVEIQEGVTKLEIPYNSKYKRLKRSKLQKERTALAIGQEGEDDTQDDVLLYCLGDVLQSEEEVRDWQLTDWSKDDEDRMSHESFEWIRMDADFEWIGKFTLGMPGYMYLSQLQQDRDIVAQYEVRPRRPRSDRKSYTDETN